MNSATPLRATRPGDPDAERHPHIDRASTLLLRHAQPQLAALAIHEIERRALRRDKTADLVGEREQRLVEHAAERLAPASDTLSTKRCA
jgi:hypothetical protein